MVNRRSTTKRFFTFCVGVVGNSSSGQIVQPRICWLPESFTFVSRTIDAT